ncbi:hypothetical protein BC835DRAFT_888060 [Cytidiella melzeri]|nr:hypothetical protein BC835DRAFT_888060 [Cytidiella melzeri]
MFYNKASPLHCDISGDEDAPSRWSLGQVPYEDLRLLDVHHVSTEWWQPVLLCKPRAVISSLRPSSSGFRVGGHSFMDFYDRNYIPDGWIIPQDTYGLPSPFETLPNVSFRVDGMLGIRLVDAADPDFRGLDNPHFAPLLAETTKKIYIRILWPGYEHWHDILHVYDHSYDANPCNMKQLAHMVALKVEA